MEISAVSAAQHEIDEVVISSMKMTEERVEEVMRMCSERQIKVKRMRITMEDLTSVENIYYSRKAQKLRVSSRQDLQDFSG